MPDILLEPYVEALGEFPITGTPAEKLRAAVKYAVRAPSSHNSQPWRFRVTADHLELLADRTRALPVIDPADRELTISCGAALYHLRVGLQHFGTAVTVQPFPEPGNPDLLARVTIAGPHEMTPEDHGLFEAIDRRRTYRLPFEPRVLPDRLQSALERAALREGARFDVFRTPESREAVADLVAEADRLQMADRRFRRELAAWMRPNHPRPVDGIPGYALGWSDVMAAAGPLVVRTFDVGSGVAAKNRQLAEGSPMLALIGTDHDSPPHWLAAGQALARVLLRAQVDGVAASFLNQPIEVEEFRLRLQALVGRMGFPQVLLRLGYGEAIKASPRRPTAEVCD